ncbi:MAG: hypothetical protein JWR16_3635 [Nevskia sp.]|nr:hypothetical protein [Nevskia sp.]
MKPSVYIQSNAKQLIGALVSEYALKRNSAAPENFEVCLIHAEDFPFLAAREGQTYLRDGASAVWRNDDLQSFPPLRFAVPGLMDYRGRALVIDPDVFAVGDVNELLACDMQHAAILARHADDEDAPGGAPHWASSVMLLDCAKLKHWRVEEDFGCLFAFERDYREWMWLRLEVAGAVAPLAPVWNDFDHLTPATRMLHNTRRRTQPWKTGLAADFVTHGTSLSARAKQRLRRLRSALTGDQAPQGRYQPHPDPRQERFFFTLLVECMDRGIVTTELLKAEIARKHIRSDAFELAAAARREPLSLASLSATAELA